MTTRSAATVKVLADENMHPIVVATFRAAGFETEWVRESMPGASDRDILSRPDIGVLALVTFDRDFGDLIFNQGYPPPRAILYSRLDRSDPAFNAQRLLAALQGIADGCMTTVLADGLRVKPFPSGADDD